MNRISLPSDYFCCQGETCGKRTLEYTSARISFTFTTNSETTFPRRYTAGGVKKQYVNMLTPWLWHGGHTPGYRNCCALGYAFYNSTPFNLTFPIWRLPECINAFPTNKLKVRRERIHPFRKVGIHPRLDKWYWLYHFIRWFSIQPDVSNMEAGGMHKCIPYE